MSFPVVVELRVGQTTTGEWSIALYDPEGGLAAHAYGMTLRKALEAAVPFEEALVVEGREEWAA